MLEHEISELRVIVERHAGVLLDSPNDILAARITDHVQSLAMTSAAELIDRLRNSVQETDALLERLLDGQTSFFRYPEAFTALTQSVFSQIESQKPDHGPRTLRIWSAGCSSGEETYSLALAISDSARCQGAGWNIRIIGSDIRRQALQSAERGLYPPAAVAHLPLETMRTYFAKVGEHLLVKPRLRNLVTFSPMNLANPSYVGRFDCIFCMDVLSRFSMAQRIPLAQRLHLYLEPGGYLLLGPEEKLPAANVHFQRQSFGSVTLYQKPRAATARAGSY